MTDTKELDSFLGGSELEQTYKKRPDKEKRTGHDGIKFNINLTQTEYDRLDNASKNLGATKASIIRLATLEYLNRLRM
jgi:hypothetical protein